MQEFDFQMSKDKKCETCKKSPNNWTDVAGNKLGQCKLTGKWVKPQSSCSKHES